MNKLRCFSAIDLTVVVGLILVLSGAALIMFGRVSKNSRDNQRINNADKIFEAMQSYYDNNFHCYPTADSADRSSQSYQSVQIGEGNDAFLQISFGDVITSLPEEPDGYSYVYVYSSDGKEAAIVVRQLESEKSKCNTSASDAPQIIKDYLTKDPGACYFKAS